MGYPSYLTRENYQRWDSEQTRLLKESFAKGKDLHEMTKIINDHIKDTRPGAIKTLRTADSIAYKLRHLNLISDDRMKSMLKVKRIFVNFNRLNNYEEIRQAILSRDNKTCVVCGKKENLQLAHIVPFRETFQKNLPELVILCKDCHKTFDRYNEFETEKIFNYMCKIYSDYQNLYKLARRYNPITNRDLCEIKRINSSE
jgi:hypothetical protein